MKFHKYSYYYLLEIIILNNMSNYTRILAQYDTKFYSKPLKL